MRPIKIALTRTPWGATSPAKALVSASPARREAEVGVVPAPGVRARVASTFSTAPLFSLRGAIARRDTCSAAMTYQLPPEVIARGIAECAGVPGRFERVDEGQPFAVVVDYSHTDDALRNAISVARTLDPDCAQTWVIFDNTALGAAAEDALALGEILAENSAPT